MSERSVRATVVAINSGTPPQRVRRALAAATQLQTLTACLDSLKPPTEELPANLGRRFARGTEAPSRGRAFGGPATTPT